MADNSSPTSLNLQVVTPQGMVEDVSVGMVTLPGVEGDFSVLPGHAPLISILAPGVIVYQEGGMPRLLSVSGGFAEVTAGRVLVLARTCEGKDDIDLARAEKSITDSEERLLTMSYESEERAHAEERLARGKARAAVVKGETPYNL
ncbi:MAG: ATP synthase F1 subunit epsilon [Nitrospinae bacterium]|nr:ATP synthase F1 subunit epsilon [Nitrospinota bacterium]